MDHCSGCCLAVILIPLLCIALVACAVIYVLTSAPSAPIAHFKPTFSDAQVFDTALNDATNTARTQGWFALKFRENEISSWMALEGADFAEQHGYDWPFEDVQVGLDDEKMTFYGKLTYQQVKLPVLVTIKPKVDSAGKMKFDITSVELGGLRAPDFVLKSVSQQLQDVLVTPFEDLPGSYYLYQETLVIENGSFEVQGRIG